MGSAKEEKRESASPPRRSAGDARARPTPWRARLHDFAGFFCTVPTTGRTSRVHSRAEALQRKRTCSAGNSDEITDRLALSPERLRVALARAFLPPTSGGSLDPSARPLPIECAPKVDRC